MTTDYIKEVIEENIEAGIMFTAFDVAQKVWKYQKEDGETTQRYRDIKSDIHASALKHFDNGSSGANSFGPGANQSDFDGDSLFVVRFYLDRKLIDVMGNGVKAFVYYTEGQNPSDYVSSQKPASNADSGQSTTSTQTTSVNPSVSTTAGFKRNVDKRGTLTVPAKLLRDAGFKPFQAAYINVSTVNIMTVDKTDKLGSTKYKVDRDNNIRITRKTLVKGNPANTYRFVGGSDNIQVIAC
jgi:bifunctional DNA-binding transcriptional regulator/antitoxin component of YhaV-PrlF toxin-antitoxin module